MTTVEILKAAREKVRAPGAWCQVVFAKNSAGDETGVHQPDAVSWCVHGALESSGYWPDAREVFLKAISEDSVLNWNDAPGRTQAEVLAAFDKAIELAESQP